MLCFVLGTMGGGGVVVEIGVHKVERAKYASNHRINALRPFLTQSDLSVENGLFRLKPKSGYVTQSKKGFLDLTLFG